MIRLLVGLLLIILFPGGCRDADTNNITEKPAALLLTEPVTPVVMELPSEAIPVWREALPQPGTLVLMSIHPFLQPIDDQRTGEVKALVRSGSRELFRQRGSFYRADPVLVPTEAVSAALVGGLFKEVVWVFPNSAAPEKISLTTLRQQLTEAQFLTTAEAQALITDGAGFAGTVRGVPLRAVHAKVLPEMAGPFVLHIDLGYFRGLYQGGVKTPVYELLQQSCLELKAAQWRPQVVTLSYSTVEGAISTDVRFLLGNLADILRDPGLLEQMPASWAKRDEALYSGNFFLDQKVRDLYRENAVAYPQNAAAQYDDYRSLFSQKQVEAALDRLGKAVALDAGYASVYLELAEIAGQDDNPKMAAEFLEKAGCYFPENPFIDLYRARFLLQAGQFAEAEKLIARLQELTWSTRLHNQIPTAIRELSKRQNRKEKPAGG